MRCDTSKRYALLWAIFLRPLNLEWHSHRGISLQTLSWAFFRVPGCERPSHRGISLQTLLWTFSVVPGTWKDTLTEESLFRSSYERLPFMRSRNSENVVFVGISLPMLLRAFFPVPGTEKPERVTGRYCISCFTRNNSYFNRNPMKTTGSNPELSVVQDPEFKCLLCGRALGACGVVVRTLSLEWSAVARFPACPFYPHLWHDFLTANPIRVLKFASQQWAFSKGFPSFELARYKNKTDQCKTKSIQKAKRSTKIIKL